MISPEADADFLDNMEDGLDVSPRPYEDILPVLCMDEQPVQLVK